MGGIDISGVNLDFPGQANVLGDLRMPPSRWELAADAAEQREQQAELLSALIERQDAMIDEQKRQAEEQREAARASKFREIVVIVLTAATLVVGAFSALYAVHEDMGRAEGENQNVYASEGDTDLH